MSTRRILLIILGVFVVAGSVAGFYFMSDAFDKRRPVLVAAVDIQKGDTVGAGHFTSDSAVMGSIPHIPYTPDAQFAFDGFAASQPIPAGTVILGDMFIPPTLPGPGELELTVEFDTSLLTSPAYNGDTVLIVVPGVEPTAEDPGRPSEAIDTLVLGNYQDGAMTMFFKAEDLDEWSAWKLLPEAIDAAPQIMAVPLGTEPEEFAQLINAAWRLEWEPRAAAVTPLVEEPQAGPGELELIVSLDTSLVPTQFSEGDTVLLIDPGRPPESDNVGRPRSVLRTIDLKNFDGAAIRLFAPVDEWVEWLALPEKLGASPMVLPIPEGTDTDAMIADLNGEWRDQWLAAIGEPPASEGQE